VELARLAAVGLFCFCPAVTAQDHITPEELAELEAAEGWVDMLAELEDLEEDHLVSRSLSCGAGANGFIEPAFHGFTCALANLDKSDAVKALSYHIF
jgi:hypothetical protein